LESLDNNYWPSWYPDKTLASRDLIALEDFLLCQLTVVLQDPISHGIVAFDPSVDLVFEKDGRNTRFEILRVKGLTPAKKPVVVETQPLSFERELANQELPRGFDISVCLDNNNNNNDKRSLKVAEVNQLTDALPELSENQLYLGRYETIEEQLVLHTRPWVYTLSAISVDNVHWLSPLKKLLTYLLRQTKNFNLTHPIDNVLSQNIIQLAHDWQSLSIATLEQKLVFLSAINQHREDQTDTSELLRETGKSTQLESNASSEMLPEILASLWGKIDEGTITLRNPEDYTYSVDGSEVIFSFVAPQNELELNFPQIQKKDLMFRFGTTMKRGKIIETPIVKIDLNGERHLRVWPFTGEVSKIEVRLPQQ
jgi:hypothetical protein